jgi:hypothetical protein
LTAENSSHIQWSLDQQGIIDFDRRTQKVTGKRKGVVRISATHERYPQACSAQLSVEVVHPNCSDCPLQYVKIRDDLPDAPGGSYSFNTSVVSLGKRKFSNGTCYDFPVSVTLVPDDSWQKEGEHSVKVDVKEFDGFSVGCPVVTVRRPYFTENGQPVTRITLLVGCSANIEAHVPVGDVKLVKGSSSVFAVGQSGTTLAISALEVGTGDVVIEDTQFPGWPAKLVVEVCRVKTVEINLPVREVELKGTLSVKVDYTSSCTGVTSCLPSGALHAIDTETRAASKAFEIQDDRLIAISAGWAIVYADRGGVKSNEVLVQAFAPLRVDGPVGENGVQGWIPITRHEGPRNWSDGGQE